MSEPSFFVRAVESETDLDAVRTLFREYEAWLDAPVCFDGFEDELNGLPGVYVAPKGALLVAHSDDLGVFGVAAVRPHDERNCELKRVYVLPAGRGRGAGKALIEAAIAFVRQVGCKSLCLETLPKLGTAIGIYEELGFRLLDADAGAEVVYMELNVSGT